MFTIDNYKKDIWAICYQNKKIKTKTNGIISIICACNHCWGLIVFYPYHICLKVIFGLNKQKNILMSFQLDIWLTQHWIVKNISKSKWLNVWKLHLVQWPNHILVKYYIKKTRVLALLMFYEIRKILRKFSKCWVVSFIQLSAIMSVLII